MPKILRLINRFNLGGPTFNVAYLSRYMDGYETLLAGGEKDESEDSSEFIVEQLGLKPVKISAMRRSINPLNDIKAFLAIRKLILEYKPDIVHTHASKAGTLGRLAAISCRVPVIVHTFHGHVFHSYFGKLKTGIFKTIERFLAGRSTCIVAISERQKHELCDIHRICQPEKTKVIPLGFDLNRFRDLDGAKRRAFRDKYKLEEDEIAVGIIGRLVPVKNHDLFLRAIAEISGSLSNRVRFFIVGDGEKRADLLRSAGDYGIDHSYLPENGNLRARLVFTSWIKEVDSVMAGLDLVVLCSFNEGTPVSLIEAQAANRPILSTDVGGIRNIVAENETAILVPSNNLPAFSEALKRLLSDPGQLRQMGQKGWDLVGEKYHYTRLVTDMSTLYDTLLKAREAKK
jgi:glycosyltransferase involved in cell wall biosynthesis